MTSEFRGQPGSIPWSEFEPEGLESFLRKNRQGVGLRRVAIEYLFSETEFLQDQKSLDFHSLDGLSNFCGDMETVFELIDEEKKGEIENILGRLFSTEGLSAQDRLSSIADALEELEEAFPGGLERIYVDDPSKGLKSLSLIVSRAQVLQRDPTGFELADLLVESADLGYNQDDPEYPKVKNAYDQAAQHYKRVYNLLIENGATSDV